MDKYFVGMRNVADFYLVKEKKRSLHCSVSEYWKKIFSDEAKCGGSFSQEVVKRKGIKESSKKSLESHIGVSFGFNAIASFEMGVKERVSFDVTWEVETIETNRIEIPAPRYGCHTVVRYQKMREYYLDSCDNRFFGNEGNNWDFRFEEALPYYHNASKCVDYHPDCNPPEDLYPPGQATSQVMYAPDGTLYAVAGNVSYEAEYRLKENKVLEVSFEDRKILIALTEYQTMFVQDAFSPFSVEIKPSQLPENMLFQGDLTGETVQIEFSPFSDESYNDEPCFVVDEDGSLRETGGGIRILTPGDQTQGEGPLDIF